MMCTFHFNILQFLHDHRRATINLENLHMSTFVFPKKTSKNKYLEHSKEVNVSTVEKS